MRENLKKLFYRWAYLDLAGTCRKKDTYFYRFANEIVASNLHMMRSMSAFMLIISLFIIVSTYTRFGAQSLRGIYVLIVVLETALLAFIQWLFKKHVSAKGCTVLAALHLFHMLALGGYIGVSFSKDETALLFVVILTISSMIFTLPPMLSMSISTICTIGMMIASYCAKESYWFESDVLNGVSVLLFSIMLGWRINRVRAEEAFARADAQRLNGELKKISITDPLTGLNNHRSFQDSYYEMFYRASTQKLPMGVVMMDLDKFKSFNDHYGHVSGDDCLRHVAAAIAAAVPEGAIVCRYGGEEFIALLNETLCYDAATIGEEIRSAVAALKIPHDCASHELKLVTLSLGAYVGVPSKTQQPMSFVAQADKALYQSKEAGRNRLTVTFG